jgi:farnesol dehydrogenase
MEKVKVFVTGGTGFIGMHLIKQLLDEGCEVHAIYRSESKIAGMKHDNLIWFKGDILDMDVLKTAMQDCSQVYHVAAYASAWEEKPGDFRKYNVQGTINIIETAKEAKVEKIVVTSTAGVFGPSIVKFIDEQSVSPLPHFTGYELSKAESENLIAQYVQKGMNIVIVNPTRVFGPGLLSESNSVTILIKKYINGKWRFVPGNGKSIGNYAYVEDVAKGHILAMKNGKAGQKYILGGENLSYNDIFSHLDILTGKRFLKVNIPLLVMLLVAHFLLLLNRAIKLKPAFTPAHVRKFNYNWELTVDKAISQLGYQVTPFPQALKKTVEYVSKTK